MKTEEPKQLDLVEEIARLNARLAELEPKQQAPAVPSIPEHEIWPKKLTLRLTSNREDMLMFADKWSMTKQAKLELYKFEGQSVTLTVNQDGTFEVDSNG